MCMSLLKIGVFICIEQNWSALTEVSLTYLSTKQENFERKILFLAEIPKLKFAIFLPP